MYLRLKINIFLLTYVLGYKHAYTHVFVFTQPFRRGENAAQGHFF